MPVVFCLKPFSVCSLYCTEEGLRVAYNCPIVLPQSLPDHSPKGRAPLLLTISEPEREQGFLLPCQPFTAVDFPEHQWPLASRRLAHLSANIPFVLRTMLPSFLPCFTRPFVPPGALYCAVSARTKHSSELAGLLSSL